MIDEQKTGFAAVTTFQAGDHELEICVGGYPSAERAAKAAAAMRLALRGQEMDDGLPRLVATVPGGEVAIDDADMSLWRLREGSRGKPTISDDDFEPVAGVTVGDLPALLRHTAGATGNITFGSLSYGFRNLAAAS